MEALSPVSNLQAGDARLLSYLAHRARPFGAVAFMESDVGLGMPRLFPRQADFVHRIFPEPDGYESPIFTPGVEESVALWGKGSGKDTIAAAMQLYVTYRLMLHPDPQAWLRLAPASNIDLINVAYNADQAKLVFFELMKTLIRGSPFFSVVPGFDADRDVLDRVVRFPKHVWFHSMHSQAEASEGKNTLYATLDEADAFTDKSKARNAHAVYETLKSSAQTRYKDNHHICTISWPRHARSFTIEKYEESMRHPRRIVGSRGATWEIRTDRSKQDFASQYEKNPERADAMFGTLPPATEEAFFRLSHKIDDSLLGVEVVKWEPTVIEVAGKEYAGVSLLAHDPMPGKAYRVHCDTGLTNDSYTLAMVRAEGQRRIVEALIVWEPKPGRPVYYPHVREVILQLCSWFDVQKVTFDRWNSAESVQLLLAEGIDAEALTFSQPDQLSYYENLKALAYGDNLILPRTGLAVPVLVQELKRLQLLNARKVDHPDGESKDVADAVAAAAFYAEEAVEQGLGSAEVASATPTDAMRDLGVGGFNDSLLQRPW